MSKRRGASLALAGVIILLLSGCSQAPRLALSGDLGTPDPAIVMGENGAPSYVFSTGEEAVNDGAIQIRSSKDGKYWSYAGTVWDKKPAWLTAAVPGVSNLWAPALFHHGSTWYLYYAASTFGSNRSVIGLATNSTLDAHSSRYRWVDRGAVIASKSSDDFNAIDPTIVDDASGTPWMAFGSFWSGIRMVQLDWPSGKRADSKVPLRIADRGTPPNAIEGSTIIRHGGAYFLIVSRDLCCQGAASTYNMAVGRSHRVTGPYLDKSGHPMLKNGGTLLLKSHGNEVGPGGESYSNGYLAWHFYDVAAGGVPTLAIQKLGWGQDGWPTLH